MSAVFIGGVIMVVVIIALLWLLTGAPAGAGVMYKCVDNGKVSYGDRPCETGKSETVTIHAAPEYSAADKATLVRQTKEVARIEKEHAKQQAQLEHERERAAERTRRSAAVHAKKCAALTLAQRWALEDARAAAGKQAGAAKLKARRAAEKLALECPA